MTKTTETIGTEKKGKERTPPIAMYLPPPPEKLSRAEKKARLQLLKATYEVSLEFKHRLLNAETPQEFLLYAVALSVMERGEATININAPKDWDIEGAIEFVGY